VFLCVITTVFGAFFRNNNLPVYNTGNPDDLKMDYVLYYKDSSSQGVLEIIRIFVGFFTTFNTLIPISLMITNEVLKSIQIMIMDSDKNMAKLPDERLKMLSMKLHEDLGCVKYIFTDKTGTLTRNEMLFKAVSIYTILFDEADNEDVVKKKSIFSSIENANRLVSALVNDIPTNIVLVENSPFDSYKEAITEFFLNIALNHNVLTENQNDVVSFQGSNPDEVTLVTSACELGVEFIERTQNLIKLKVLNELKEFEIIQKFDFTSSRMRSSIIVRGKDGLIKVYMKGSDSVIFSKIDQFSKDNLYRISKEHIDVFAKQGLRTLCYSYRVLSQDEYNTWLIRYEEMKYNAINDKSLGKKVEEIISELESNMTLLGVTGLEDRLQDNVTQDIQDYIEAGINVWMITGDKLDTAESIGYSCKLFNDDTEVFRIKAMNREEVYKKMEDILNQMKSIEAEMEVKHWRQNNINDPFIDENIKKIVKVEEEEKKDIESNLHQQPKKQTIFNSFIAKNNQNIIQNIELSLRENDQKDFEISLHEVDITNNKRDDRTSKIVVEDTNKDAESIYNLYDKKNSAFHMAKQNHTIMDKRKNSLINARKDSNISPWDNNRKGTVNDDSIIKFMYNNNYFENQSANMTFNKFMKPSEPDMNTSKDIVAIKPIVEEEEDIHSPKKIEKIEYNTPRPEDKANLARSKSMRVNDKQLQQQKDFDEMIQYIQGQIENIDKKKKSAFNFEFKPKKPKEEDDEDEDEEFPDLKVMNFGLIIEGPSISHCLHPKSKNIFWKIMKKTRSIVACRCSPLQKAEIVNFVKNKSKQITLAIGDGGNDVNMIKVNITNLDS
jgi:magnesium-transporting ATPase (P-type)